MPRLEVVQAGVDDYFGDVARVHIRHRPGLRAGGLIAIETNGRKIVAAVRGPTGNKSNTISLDTEFRERLNVKLGLEYEFTISKAGVFDSFIWGWKSSDPAKRVAMRLGLTSVAMGMVGLLLGCVSLIS